MSSSSEGGTGQPTTGVGGLSVPIGVHEENMREKDLALFLKLREQDERFAGERDQRYAERNKRQDDAVKVVEELMRVYREADQEAINKALTAQKEQAEKHNDLLRTMEKRDSEYFTKDRFDDYTKSSDVALKLALERINEKLEENVERITTQLTDYVTRFEQRQRELEQALNIQQAAAKEAQAISEAEGRKTREAAEHKFRESQIEADERTRKQNRNMAGVAILVTIVVAVANGAGPF